MPALNLVDDFRHLKRSEKSTIFGAMSPTEKFAQKKDAITDSCGGEEAVDLSLLEDSLRLTPWQRFLENERSLALVRMLEAAKLRADGAAEPNS